MTLWDEQLHVSCFCSNAAFWVHYYVTEGNGIMCVADIIIIVSIFNGSDISFHEG